MASNGGIAMYYIRNAERADLAQILEIYRYARGFMERTGNPNQWGKNHPPQQQLEADLRHRKLFAVCEGEKIRGVFYFHVGEDPTYGVIRDGQWNSDREYGTIHCIASDGSGGILKACVAYCEKLCPYLRIDTHKDNRVMQAAVEKLGFRYCGIIYIADGSPRLAYDRI